MVAVAHSNSATARQLKHRPGVTRTTCRSTVAHGAANPSSKTQAFDYESHHFLSIEPAERDDVPEKAFGY